MTWFLRIFVFAVAVGLAADANAQVTIDQGALDSLPKAAPAPAPHPARPPARRAPAHPGSAVPARASPAHAVPAKPTQPALATPLPAIPPAPPAAPTIPPPIMVPTLPQPPPPPIPVAASAPGSVRELPDGLRITFGTDQSDLNPVTAAALTELARRAQGRADTVFNLLAHAPGVAEDPSSPRRLSMMRGLAARAVLIREGIPSTRIYLRALGPQDLGDGPADRVDVLVGPTPTPAALPPVPPR